MHQMGSETPVKQRIRRILFFFPFQLLFMHLKRNHLLLLIWLVLFGFVTGALGMKYGIPYLFLYPEYLGKVEVWSHFILGFSMGGFIMAFNIYSYVMYGHLFPFLATLARPFLKFCFNNSVLPLIFLLTYIRYAVDFQLNLELVSGVQVVWHIAAFLLGVSAFVGLSLFYFLRTNKDVHKLGLHREEEMKETPRKKRKKHNDPLGGSVLHKKTKRFDLKTRSEWTVLTYLSHPFKISLARKINHYEFEVLQQIFSQNQINASFFEMLMLASFIVFGSFHDTPVFIIPAGASFVLLFTIVLMLISAFYSWFRGWTVSILVLLFMGLNYGSERLSFLQPDNRVYGLDYTTRVPYTSASLAALRDDKKQFHADKSHHIDMLNRWANRQNTPAGEKPRLVLISSSGGGLRSALWTFHTLQHIDASIHGKLMNKTHLINGSSGGMIGAAYYRELGLQAQQNDTFQSFSRYADNIAGDMLNPICFTFATHDIFVRYRKFKEGDISYTKDRAYAFEEVLNKNTHHLLNKRLSDYYLPEYEGKTPMMIFAPTVVNDGRRMLVSSQPISFMTNNRPEPTVSNVPNVESIEFRRMFASNRADNVRFTSVLRMSATFPYILPMASLPTEPQINVMDAGLRDNFGLHASLQFIYVFKDWIAAHTSGVAIVQIRDTQKEFEIDEREISSLTDHLIAPAGALYANFTKIQDYHQDQMMQQAGEWLDAPLNLVSFELSRHKNETVSLSWHLTQLEKDRILKAINTKGNQAKMKYLKSLIVPAAKAR